VTGDFLAYARPRPIDGRAIPLSAALGYTADLVRSRGAERGVALVVEAPSEVIATFDPTQLHQALLNLALNAIDAAPAGGRVTLSAWQDGDDVTFRVRNSGLAIPTEVVDRLFEPFFTTRPTGTGLGLPIAQSIARAHGGDLVLVINDSTGVAFDLRVPSRPGARPPAGD
jgi:signal transduction histidine kinase